MGRFTRIDYRIVANIIDNAQYIDDAEDVRYYIASHLADFFAKGNELFDREIFLEHSKVIERRD